MPIQTLEIIKSWFKTGLKPTEQQFSDTWDSFRHKDEKIPNQDIEDIDVFLDNKVDKSEFQNHLASSDSHPKKEDKANKNQAGGYAGLDNLSKIPTSSLHMVDDLTTGGNNPLTAEQGKILGEQSQIFKEQIDAMNTLLSSDNVDLDSVQEIVDAVENIKMSLNTILVNNLTTGGVAKALTAEQGKTLKGLLDLLTANKVDKVSGDRLINASEITKLATLTPVTTTTKTIASTVLNTQNAAGFVSYINALSPVLLVGPNEIVKYITSDTGRTFELNLRGRSFGVGQTPITIADVTEITSFLNKDIALSNYPQNRNDGVIPINKVLSVNSAGKLGLYTVGLMPAPFLEYIVPDNQLPNTTFNVYLHGSFFTPTMTVSIAGQTVNSVIFKSSSLVLINVTTGIEEGLFSITLNNGTSATFPNAMFVILGTVYTPTSENFKILTGSATLDADGIIRTTGRGIKTTADLDYIIPAGQNFRITGKATKSPIYINDITNQNLDYISLVSVNNAMKFKTMISVYATTNNNLNFYQASTGDSRQGFYNNILNGQWYIERIGTTVTVYCNNVLRLTFTDTSNEDLKINLGINFCDLAVKYIALHQ
ncbi:hypothetical protein ACFFLS_09955 [Flavobacterium procerum]|uniref:Tail fiber protein n=1 Tax=Flavobacterium procerum TaxID=1455569 RepID=A0ABV6BPH1_9FLAO